MCHSSPLNLFLPNTSVNVFNDFKCKAFLSVKTYAFTMQTTSSKAPGKYAPVCLTSRSSPVTLSIPFISVHFFRAFNLIA